MKLDWLIGTLGFALSSQKIFQVMKYNKLQYVAGNNLYSNLITFTLLCKRLWAYFGQTDSQTKMSFMLSFILIYPFWQRCVLYVQYLKQVKWSLKFRYNCYTGSGLMPVYTVCFRLLHYLPLHLSFRIKQDLLISHFCL